MINFHKQSPVYVQIDGETVFKQYVEGSCNTADLSNLPTDSTYIYSLTPVS